MIGRRGVFAALLGAPIAAKAAIEATQTPPPGAVGVAGVDLEGPSPEFKAGRRIADQIEKKIDSISFLEGHKFSHFKSWSRSFAEGQLIADYYKRREIQNKIGELLYGDTVDLFKLYQLAKEVGVTPDFEI